MQAILCIFALVFFFELRSLFKAKEKKEAALYIILAAFAVFIGVFIMFVPEYTSFSHIIWDLFNASH